MQLIKYEHCLQVTIEHPLNFCWSQFSDTAGFSFEAKAGYWGFWHSWKYIELLQIHVKLWQISIATSLLLKIYGLVVGCVASWTLPVGAVKINVTRASSLLGPGALIAPRAQQRCPPRNTTCKYTRGGKNTAVQKRIAVAMESCLVPSALHAQAALPIRALRVRFNRFRVRPTRSNVQRWSAFWVDLILECSSGQELAGSGFWLL